MSFKNPQQRAMYFEKLRQSGQLNPSMKQPPLGLPVAQHNNMTAMSPALPQAIPPKSNQPNMIPTGLAPNPMVPLNPSGANKFGKIKKFF